MPSNLLLTGQPRVGKTTLIKKLIQPLEIKIGGFWTEEIRAGGRRVGFRIRSNTDEDVLAHIDSTSRSRVGPYGVNISAFERVGVRAIEQGMVSDDLIIMDELGRMELYSDRFRETAVHALDCTKPVLGVVQDRRNTFLDSIRARKDITLVRITLENRAHIAGKLSAHLGLMIRS